jgi:hypothetical protein
VAETAAVAGSRRRRAFNSPRGRLRLRRGSRGHDPEGVGDGGAKTSKTVEEFTMRTKVWGTAGRGRGNDAVDCVERVQNLKYIHVVISAVLPLQVAYLAGRGPRTNPIGYNKVV